MLSARGFFQRQNDCVSCCVTQEVQDGFLFLLPTSGIGHAGHGSSRPNSLRHGQRSIAVWDSVAPHFDHGSVEAIYGSQISLRQLETSFNILNGFPVLDDAKSCGYRHLREMGIYFQAKRVIFRVFNPRNDVFYQPNYGFIIFYRGEMMGEITVNLMLGFDV